MRELGIMNAELGRMYTKRPVCVNSGQFFDSISFEDSFGACFLLGCGMAGALLVFLLEKVARLAQPKWFNFKF